MKELFKNHSSLAFIDDYIKYQIVLDVIVESIEYDGYSRISQVEIADMLNISQSFVSKTIKILEDTDQCIEKISSRLYKVNHKHIVRYNPLNKIIRYCVEAQKNEKILKMNCEEQSKILGMSVDDVKMVKTYVKGNFE